MFIYMVTMRFKHISYLCQTKCAFLNFLLAFLTARRPKLSVRGFKVRIHVLITGSISLSFFTVSSSLTERRTYPWKTVQYSATARRTFRTTQHTVRTTRRTVKWSRMDWRFRTAAKCFVGPTSASKEHTAGACCCTPKTVNQSEINVGCRSTRWTS